MSDHQLIFFSILHSILINFLPIHFIYLFFKINYFFFLFNFLMNFTLANIIIDNF